MSGLFLYTNSHCTCSRPTPPDRRDDFAAAARHRHAASWPAIEAMFDGLEQECRVMPLALAAHERQPTVLDPFR